MSEIILQTESVDQTRDLAARIAKHLPRPTVVALSGQLGAGKTHFIKGLGQGLGLDPRKICSATFVLIAEYGEEPKLIHIDAYRIDEPEELEDIGWYELIDEPDALIAVEWAEKIQPILPTDRLDIQIEILDDHRRQFTLRPTGPNCETALSAAFAQS
jgi:tRNA threonylcarbamoyladenosine biosynthesis protein TsaE